MSQTQTLSLIDDIDSLVSVQLQVVSYKWLSRNYMVSSNEAKRLLQEFVKKHEGGLEVVYALSGWLKGNNPSYHVKLVTGPKLAEAQQQFDGNCSVQVYSVQASIPKDPAVLWNAEFIQAEELFRWPSSVDNCLRDNRFCGISNSFVRMNVDGSPAVAATPQAKSVVGTVPTKSNIVHQPPKNVTLDSTSKVDLKSQNGLKDVKSESNGTGNTGAQDNINKPTAEKEKTLPLATGKKKVQADKSGSGGSLASFWGRPTAKPKPCSTSANNNNTVSNPAEATEDAQTRAHEAGEGDSGDDDNHGMTVRRSSNRKRRVVFDFSDEDEDYVINLGSPDLPNKQSSRDSKQNDKNLLEKAAVNFDLPIEIKPRVKEERSIEQKTLQPTREDLSVISKCTSTGKSSTEKLQSGAPKISVNKDSVKKTTPSSPKRKKVMKTRIDERGREVTEVVWEGEETEVKTDAKKADTVTAKKSDNNASINAVNSVPATKKPATISNTNSNATGKGGSKKGGNSKDPKQGNILSFFKKV